MSVPARDLLRDKGLRATPQRLVILETLAALDGHHHLTPRDIFEQVRPRLPGINVTTVYRTLEGLHEAGLVDQMVSGHDHVRFSFRHPGHRHGHLSCHRCGTVLTMDFELVGRLAELVAVSCDFQVDEDHLTLSGLCRGCRNGHTPG